MISKDKVLIYSVSNFILLSFIKLNVSAYS